MRAGREAREGALPWTLVALVFVGLVGVSGCSGRSSRHAAAPNVTSALASPSPVGAPAGAPAGPAQQACDFPTAASLTELAQFADIVVTATYSGAQATSTQVVSGPGGTLYTVPLGAVKVLGRQRSSADQALNVTAIVANSDWSKLLVPGDYLLFLETPATPVDGLNGVFRFVNGNLVPGCAGTTDLSGTPIQAVGAPAPTSLISSIPSGWSPLTVQSKPPSASGIGHIGGCAASHC